MQIVIDIDDDIAYGIIEGNNDEPRNIVRAFQATIADAIKEGVPLPEHGRVVDISKIDEDKIESDNPIICLTMNGQYTEAVSLDYLESLPTILEANKAESV